LQYAKCDFIVSGLQRLRQRFYAVSKAYTGEGHLFGSDEGKCSSNDNTLNSLVLKARRTPSFLLGS